MRFGTTARTLARSYRPGLEILEDRNCPSAPSIQNLAVRETSWHIFTASGQVQDEHPAGLTVAFTGAAWGWTTTDANGNFSTPVMAFSLGTVTATVVDNELLTGSATSEAVGAAPIVYDFVASRQLLNVWVFSGKVEDEYASGQSIHFDGLPSLAGKTAMVDSNGNFTLTVELQIGEEGTVSAQMTDTWGLVSNLALCNVNPGT